LPSNVTVSNPFAAPQKQYQTTRTEEEEEEYYGEEEEEELEAGASRKLV
jgi:hypothetical protein